VLDPVAVDMVSNADHLGGNATGAAISKPDQARSQIRILNLMRSSLTPQQSITIDALQALIIQGLDAKCYALLSSSCNPAYRDSSVTPLLPQQDLMVRALIAWLYSVIQPSGAQSWAVRYWTAGEPRRLKFGPFPTVGQGWFFNSIS
jgi:hypothetical protein